jgi:hypothetical protein
MIEGFFQIGGYLIAETKALKEGSLIGHKVINRVRSPKYLFFPQGNTDQKQQKEEDR